MQKDRQQNEGKIVPFHRTPEEWLDLEFASAIAAVPVPKGKPRPKRFHKIAEQDGLAPLRILARVVNDGLDVRAGKSVVKAASWALDRYVARKTNTPLHDTGEHDLAS